MDFALNRHLQILREQLRDFMHTHVLPEEKRVVEEDMKGPSPTLARLQRIAKTHGLWAPHLPSSLGGQDLGVMGMCALFREMGVSPIGPRVFHCDSPDQGNMDLLLAIASEPQKEKYLVPLCRGDITSAFCMTEPSPGAGADPSNLRTRAVRDKEGWQLHGHKWYVTGGNQASFLIVVARTSDDPDKAATLFLVDRHTPGVEHVRDISVFASPYLSHREAEFRFNHVRLNDENILGSVGDGFRYAQQRLVPSRLTHCMRWLGLGARTLDMCRNYLVSRRSFGRMLAEHQAMQHMIASNAAALHSGNLMTLHCAWMLEQGQAKEARTYSSMTKTHVARTLCKVLDDAIQMHGGLGYSNDMPFVEWYRSARAARIADGPDEVHEMVIAREFLLGRVTLLV